MSLLHLDELKSKSKRIVAMTTPSKGPEIIGVTMMFEAFAIVALGLRFWSQRILGRKLFAHDILVLFGFVSLSVENCKITTDILNRYVQQP